MDLSGVWRALGADEGLRRAFHQPAFDDTGWADLPVPGHWRSTAAFAAHDGPLLARRRFGREPLGPDRRAWLVLDGLFYLGDIWLDGAYLGATEGYFFPHVFEVTEALARGEEHVVAIEVACPRPSDKRAKRCLTGAFQDGSCLDSDWNPGGIWRPVRIEESGPVRLSRLRVLCREATPERAVLAFRAEIDSARSTSVSVSTLVAGLAESRIEQPVAVGENRIAWQVVVERPPLWWPRSLGEPNLVDVTVDVHVDGAISHRRTLRTGLRRVELSKWTASVNGERLFLKGANQGPTRMALGEATPEEMAADVDLAVKAGLDLMRVHAHVSRPELYDAADAAGLLLWQDLPLQWGYARAVRTEAVRQAREAVDLLGHHPSVLLWCGHNEPMATEAEPGRQPDGPGAAARVLPSWNKNVLDSSMRRALEKADPTRPVLAHSGVPGGDTHLSLGWYGGDVCDLPGLAARLPSLMRFVSEFGAQAPPTEPAFLGAEPWPHLDWDNLARRHGLQREVFARLGLDPASFPTFAAWRDAAQAHQADVVRFTIEHLRRLKYRPTGGFALYALADGAPLVSWAVVDHLRQPKPAFAALRHACAPVLVAADRLAASYRPGQAIALDVHVVNDLRRPLAGITVMATLDGPGGRSRWSWAGEVAADSVSRVGTIRTEAPPEVGTLVLDLSLSAGNVKASNRYESQVS